MKVLIIVAHLDDETIFAGGLIQVFASFSEVYVLGLNTKDCSIRKSEFNKASEILGFKSLYGELKQSSLCDIEKIMSLVSSKIQDILPELVVSHGEYGEYNGNHHQAVYRAVMNVAVNGAYSGSLWTFAYGSEKYDLTVNLSGDMLTKKIWVKRNCYSSQAYLDHYEVTPEKFLIIRY